MKTPYDFERFDPPILTETMLRAELQKRQRYWLAILPALAGFLSQLVLLLCGFLAAEAFPPVTLLCIGYTMVSTAGSGAIAIVYTQKRRSAP